MKEKWKSVVGYEGVYSVSNMGSVRRDKKWRNTYIGRILKPRVDNFGYEVLTLSNNGKVKLVKVHKLVMNAFVGSVPNNKNVNHKNGIKTDNRLSNLEYLTQSENVSHAYNVLGHKSSFGENHGNSKLNDKTVNFMRYMYQEGKGWGITAIAEILGYNRLTVSDAVRRITWKHI